MPIFSVMPQNVLYSVTSEVSGPNVTKIVRDVEKFTPCNLANTCEKHLLSDHLSA